MDRRRAVVGAVLLLLSAVIVVQVLDPQFEERTPPEVDFSEPPNEVAADAAKQFEYVDYAYRVDIAYNASDEWRQWGVAWVDHSNRSYRKVGPAGERQEVLYGTSAAGFVRPTIDEDWVLMGRPGFVYPAKSVTQPTYSKRLKEADAQVIDKDPSTTTIHTDVNPVKTVGDYPGSAVLVVNRSSGLIESIHVAYEPGRGETRYLRFQVIEVGTTVNRPGSIGFSSIEVFLDLLRGPLFRAL
jgi:hypothetical protein